MSNPQEPEQELETRMDTPAACPACGRPLNVGGHDIAFGSCEDETSRADSRTASTYVPVPGTSIWDLTVRLDRALTAIRQSQDVDYSIEVATGATWLTAEIRGLLAKGQPDAAGERSSARPREEVSEGTRWFPIMGRQIATHVQAIPWSVIAPCDAQARLNHSQSLERLAERGGLDPAEAVAVLEGRRYRMADFADFDEAERRLREIVRERTVSEQKNEGEDTRSAI